MELTLGNILDINDNIQKINMNLSDVIMSDGKTLESWLNSDKIKYIYNLDDSISRVSFIGDKEASYDNDVFIDVKNGHIYTNIDTMDVDSIKRYIRRMMYTPWSTRSIDFGSQKTSAFNYLGGILTSAYGDTRASKYNMYNYACEAITSTNNVYDSGGASSSGYNTDYIFGRTNINTNATEVYNSVTKVWSNKQAYPLIGKNIASVVDGQGIMSIPSRVYKYNSKLNKNTDIGNYSIRYVNATDVYTIDGLVPYPTGHMAIGTSIELVMSTNSKQTDSSEYSGLVEYNGEIWKLARTNYDMYTNKSQDSGNDSPCLIGTAEYGALVIQPDRNIVAYFDGIFKSYYSHPHANVLPKAFGSIDGNYAVIINNDLQTALIHDTNRRFTRYPYILDNTVSTFEMDLSAITPRYSGVATSINDMGYFLYGKNSRGMNINIEEYEPEVSSMISSDIIDSGRINCAISKYITTGGINIDNSTLNTSTKLDDSAVMSTSSNINIKRHSHTSSILNDNIFIYGGANETGYIQNGEKLTGESWGLTDIMLPINTKETSSSVSNNVMYIMSGVNGSGIVNNIMEFNGTTAKVSSINMSISRHTHVSDSVSDGIVTRSGMANNTNIIYNEKISGDTSYIINSILVPRSKAQGTNVTLYEDLEYSHNIISGGVNGDIELYNIERFVDIPGEIVNVNLDRKDRYTISNDKLYKL